MRRPSDKGRWQSEIVGGLGSRVNRPGVSSSINEGEAFGVCATSVGPNLLNWELGIITGATNRVVVRIK